LHQPVQAKLGHAGTHIRHRRHQPRGRRFERAANQPHFVGVFRTPQLVDVWLNVREAHIRPRGPQAIDQRCAARGRFETDGVSLTFLQNIQNSPHQQIGTKPCRFDTAVPDRHHFLGSEGRIEEWLLHVVGHQDRRTIAAQYQRRLGILRIEHEGGGSEGGEVREVPRMRDDDPFDVSRGQLP
jgi:hypothetical protein